jgi:hypothetical protein
MSWRDRLTRDDLAASANDNSAKSAVSAPKRAFDTNGTIGNAGISKKTAAKRAVPKPDNGAQVHLVGSTPNRRSVAGIGSADESDFACDGGGRTDDQDECADRIEYRPGVPGAWAEGFARFNPDRLPSDVPMKRWQRFVDDVGQFLDGSFCATAMALGWGPHDLFGCDRDRPFARIDRLGLLWLLDGGRLMALTANTATIKTSNGSVLTYRRRAGNEPGRVLAWELE